MLSPVADCEGVIDTQRATAKETGRYRANGQRGRDDGEPCASVKRIPFAMR